MNAYQKYYGNQKITRIIQSYPTFCHDVLLANGEIVEIALEIGDKTPVKIGERLANFNNLLVVRPSKIYRFVRL